MLKQQLQLLSVKLINMSQETWCGASLSDLYGASNPWGSPEFPLVSPSFNHVVLYHISNTGIDKNRPPSPQRGHDKWDPDFVRLPSSNQSLYPVDEDGGQQVLKNRWEIIETSLKRPIRNSRELADTILSYNTKFSNCWTFAGMHKFFNEHLEEEESEIFFQNTLPAIANLALSLPKLVPSPIPLLKQHKNRSLSLSQQQISCLLANAFFCTFPRRNTSKRNSEYSSYPHINFNGLYEAVDNSVFEKLKCLCHYFRRVCAKVPVGVMTFIRRSVEPKNCPCWSKSERPIKATPFHIDSQGMIENEGVGLIQVDFANKYLGGGVLNRGCVQEEIRFVICPELLISMLFTEMLRPTEALLIIGCERYSSYTGYGNTFRWDGSYEDRTPYDSSGRRRCAVLAIDALPFSRKSHQYRAELITRELNKAWVGVSACTSQKDMSELHYPGVATGNWGCGAFGGSPDLKALIQLMACTQARRPIAYYTFKDAELMTDLYNIYEFIKQNDVTVRQLYWILLKYADEGNTENSLHAFVKSSICKIKNGNEKNIINADLVSPTCSSVENKSGGNKKNVNMNQKVMGKRLPIPRHLLTRDIVSSFYKNNADISKSNKTSITENRSDKDEISETEKEMTNAITDKVSSVIYTSSSDLLETEGDNSETDKTFGDDKINSNDSHKTDSDSCTSDISESKAIATTLDSNELKIPSRSLSHNYHGFLDLEKGEGNLNLGINRVKAVLINTEKEIKRERKPSEKTELNLKNKSNTIGQTSSLFEKMTSFDAENSQLNLKSYGSFKRLESLNQKDADDVMDLDIEKGNNEAMEVDTNIAESLIVSEIKSAMLPKESNLASFAETENITDLDDIKEVLGKANFNTDLSFKSSTKDLISEKYFGENEKPSENKAIETHSNEDRRLIEPENGPAKKMARKITDYFSKKY